MSLPHVVKGHQLEPLGIGVDLAPIDNVFLGCVFAPHPGRRHEDNRPRLDDRAPSADLKRVVPQHADDRRYGLRLVHEPVFLSRSWA